MYLKSLFQRLSDVHSCHRGIRKLILRRHGRHHGGVVFQEVSFLESSGRTGVNDSEHDDNGGCKNYTCLTNLLIV